MIIFCIILHGLPHLGNNTNSFSFCSNQYDSTQVIRSIINSRNDLSSDIERMIQSLALNMHADLGEKDVSFVIVLDVIVERMNTIAGNFLNLYLEAGQLFKLG